MAVAIVIFMKKIKALRAVDETKEPQIEPKIALHDGGVQGQRRGVRLMTHERLVRSRSADEMSDE